MQGRRPPSPSPLLLPAGTACGGAFAQKLALTLLLYSTAADGDEKPAPPLCPWLEEEAALLSPSGKSFLAWRWPHATVISTPSLQAAGCASRIYGGKGHLSFLSRLRGRYHTIPFRPTSASFFFKERVLSGLSLTSLPCQPSAVALTPAVPFSPPCRSLSGGRKGRLEGGLSVFVVHWEREVLPRISLTPCTDIILSICGPRGLVSRNSIQRKRPILQVLQGYLSVYGKCVPALHVKL